MEKDFFLNRKIEAAIDIMRNGEKNFLENGHSSKIFNNCYSVYAQTNENLNYYGLLEQELGLDMVGKDILVPTASGDHALNAIFYGANSVETFDINVLSFYFYDLKETALKFLPRQIFINFFTDKILDEEIYRSISEFLLPNTKEFFDAVIEFLSAVKLKNIAEHKYALHQLIEEYGRNRPTSIIDCNPYLANEDAYLETRDRIKSLKNPVTHKFCAAHELGDCFGEKDVIILSNILKYYFPSIFRNYENGEYFMLNQESPAAVKFLKSIANVLKDDGFVSLKYNFEHNPDMELLDPCLNRLGLHTQKIYVPKMMLDEDIENNAIDRVDIATKDDNPILFER